MMRRLGKWVLAAVVLGVLVGGVWAGILIWPRPEVVLDPQAKIDSETKYQLVLWDEAFPVPTPLQGEQERAIEQALAEFHQLYPNVQVHFRLWPWGTLQEGLTAAVAKGNPPDVAMISGHRQYDLQLPITRFISDLEENGYFSPVLDRLQNGSDYWAWPSWSSVRVLALNRKLVGNAFSDLSSAAAEDAESGYRHLRLDLENMMQRASSISAQPAVVLENGTGEALALLLEGEAAPMLLGDGKLGWTQQALSETAQQLSVWISKKVVHTSSADLLEGFFTGQAPIIGPVGPWIISKVPKKDTAARAPQAQDVGFLPFPSQPELGPAEPVDYSAAVFRQARFKGAAHTRLAMEFARLYGKYMGVFYSVTRHGVPSYLPLLGVWSQRLGLDPGQQAGLIAACSGSARPELPQSWLDLRERLMDEVVLPTAIAFLQGKMPADEMAKYLSGEIAEAADQLRDAQQEQK